MKEKIIQKLKRMGIPKENRKGFFVKIFIIFFIGLAVFFSLNLFKGEIFVLKEKPEILLLKNELDGKLLAKAILIENIDKKEILFSRNSNEELPLASLTKIMTAIAVLENMDVESEVTMTPEALSEFGDAGFYLNEKWQVNELVKFMLLNSSNDAAKALWVAATLNNKNLISLMNSESEKLGLKAEFYNESGLDTYANIGGGKGSAVEVLSMMKYGYSKYYEYFEPTSKPRYNLTSLASTHEVWNTNEIISEIPGVLMSKTGFTNLTGGNLVFIYENEKREKIGIVILGSTKDGRFEEAKIAIEFVKNLENLQLNKK